MNARFVVIKLSSERDIKPSCICQKLLYFFEIKTTDCLKKHFSLFASYLLNPKW